MREPRGYLRGRGDGDRYYGLSKIGRSSGNAVQCNLELNLLEHSTFSFANELVRGTHSLGGFLFVVWDGVGIGSRGECVASDLHDRAYVTVGCAVWVEVLGVEVNVYNLGDV